MASAYDYVQIVADNDWELLGIVPNNDSGAKVKRMVEHNKKQYTNPYDFLPKLATPVEPKNDSEIDTIKDNTSKRKDNVLVGF